MIEWSSGKAIRAWIHCSLGVVLPVTRSRVHERITIGSGYQRCLRGEWISSPDRKEMVKVLWNHSFRVGGRGIRVLKVQMTVKIGRKDMQIFTGIRLSSERRGLGYNPGKTRSDTPAGMRARLWKHTATTTGSAGYDRSCKSAMEPAKKGQWVCGYCSHGKVFLKSNLSLQPSSIMSNSVEYRRTNAARKDEI